MNEDYQNRIEELERKFKALEAGGTLPKPVEDAFRERLRIDVITATTVSSKSISSENQSVNESGVASYSVLKTPDVFLQVNIGGTIYYIPAFT